MKKLLRIRMIIVVILALGLSACGGPMPDEDTTVDIWGPRRVVPVRLTSGVVERRSDSQADFQPVSVGQSISSGDEIRTAEDGRVILALPYAGLVMLDRDSHFKITSMESKQNLELFKIYLIAGQVFFIDEGTQPPDTLNGLATSPAITFEIETDGGTFTLNLAAPQNADDTARLASIAYDPVSSDITTICFEGECSLSYGDEQASIPEGEIALITKVDKASPKLVFKTWSPANFSIVTVLEFAAVNPIHFDVLPSDTSYATVHKVEGSVEASLDSDHVVVLGGEFLGDQHSLHTDEDSRAVLHLADGAVLTVGEHSIVHLTHDPAPTETAKSHLTLESGELYLVHTGSHSAEEWIIDLGDDAAIVAKPSMDDLQIALHVSYDSELDKVAVTLLDGQVTLTSGDESIELPLGKRSEVRDSHDRYANIETNYLSREIDQPEYEAWESTLLFAEIDPNSLQFLQTP